MRLRRDRQITFQRTGDNYFPYAADVDGVWWVLRLNDFPDHPLLTLFVDGERHRDLDDTPRRWTLPSKDSAPLANSEKIIEPLLGLEPYGSEVGTPCDNLFCCAFPPDRSRQARTAQSEGSADPT